MAHDLNFDELDKAVHGFMKQANDKKDASGTSAPVVKPAEDTPATTFDAPPAVRPVEPKPAASSPMGLPGPSAPKGDTPDSSPATTANSSTSGAASASASSQVHVQMRQSLAGRRAARGTFHDIIPTRVNQSPSKPTVKIEPLSDVRAPQAAPEPVAAASGLDANNQTSGEGGDRVAAKKEVLEGTDDSSLVPKDATELTASESDIPALPAAPVANSDDAPEDTMASSEITPTEPVKSSGSETDAPKILSEPDEVAAPSGSSMANDIPVPPAAPPAGDISAALMEDLQKHAADAEAAEGSEKMGTDVGNGKPNTGNSLADHPVEFADRPDASAHTTGLLETGELHAALPSHSGASASQQVADTPAAPLFDTKEYHTPIAANGTSAPTSKTTHEKVWEWIIILLLIVVALAAGVVAYLMLFKS